jgi:hypothetical protein
VSCLGGFLRISPGTTFADESPSLIIITARSESQREGTEDWIEKYLPDSACRLLPSTDRVFDADPSHPTQSSTKSTSLAHSNISNRPAKS